MRARPVVMTPAPPSAPASIVLNRDAAAYARISPDRSSKARHWRRAFPGSRVHAAACGCLCGGFSPRASPTCTMPRLCARRVTSRIITGTWKRSETSNASRVMSYASWCDAGSKHTTRAKSANTRLSCSFWELCMPGSSATATTRPPLTVTRAEFMNGSAATFNPTCFIVTIVRRPA